MFKTTRHLAQLFIVILAAAGVCMGQAAQPQPEDQQRGQSARTVQLTVGQSQVVEAPWPVQRVAVTDPKIADVRGLTPQRVLVQGKAMGATDLMLWSENEELWQARLIVGADMTKIGSDLENLFPDSELSLRQVGEAVVVSGEFTQAEHVQQMHRYLQASGVKFVDMTRVAGVQQVQLQVRVAEVSRTAIRSLGSNWLYYGNDVLIGQTAGPDGGGPINPFVIDPTGIAAPSELPFPFLSGTPISSSVTLFGSFPKADFDIFLQALAENQYLRLLAEPTLVALSGEQASFLAGGEFPIPVVQSGAVGGSTAISIEYKEFGVRLRFRPTVLGDGTIRLLVAPEVSELTDVGAVVIQGFRVPALVTRRAETTLMLKSGQSFAMAGLISRTTNARNSRIPGLGDVPILGALFRSVRYSAGETELVVLVTASLAEPMTADAAPPLPGAAHKAPNDWELYALGKLQATAPAQLSSAQSQWMHKMKFDRLRGPGAWARCQSAAGTPVSDQPEQGDQRDQAVPAQTN